MATKAKLAPRIITFKATTEDQQLIADMLAKLGVSQSSLIKMALRELANSKKVA